MLYQNKRKNGNNRHQQLHDHADRQQWQCGEILEKFIGNRFNPDFFKNGSGVTKGETYTLSVTATVKTNGSSENVSDSVTKTY